MHHPVRRSPATGRAPFAAALALTSLLAPPTLAQTQPAPPASPASAPAGSVTELPAVRVTAPAAGPARTEGSGSYTSGVTTSATGLTLSPRDTPQSVTIVTRERIDDQAADTIADALNQTTGVSLKAIDRGRNTLSVRGFDVTSFQLDGVPFATGNVGLEEFNTLLFDRIEVVRGATGLLSGAGNPSASINLVRKHADSKTLTGTVSAELGSWNHRAASVDLSTPLNADGSLRARFVADVNRQDAFIDLENTRGSLFYGVLDADLGPRTQLSVGASEQRDRRSGVYWGGLPFWYADGTRTDWDRSKTTATHWNQWDTTELTAFATLRHELPNRWQIHADLSHHRQREDSKLLWVTGLPDRETGLGMEAYPYHYQATPTQNHAGLVATGPFEWFGRSHEATAGIVYSRLNDGWSNRDAASDVAQVGDFNAWDGSYPEPELGARYVGSRGRTTQSGAYAAARLQLSDTLKLITGGRLSRWTRDEEAAAWTTSAYTIRHSSVFTPYAGLVYDLGEQLSAYASYTDIFNPQTQRDSDGAYLDPLEGKSYEAGLKGEFLDGRLNASAAVFRIDQDNFAVPTGEPVLGTNEPAYEASQGVIARGYELEVAGELSRGWNVSLGWTHYSARNADATGVAAEHPRKLLKLSSTYTLPGAGQALSVGGAVSWESATPQRAVNPVTELEEAVGQPAYAVVDLMARLALGRQWSLQLNVDNVFDKQYRTGNPWWSSFTYGEPRSAKLKASYTF